MTTIQTFFAALSAIILFLYGLGSFSRELQAVGGKTLQNWLGKITSNRFYGFIVGAISTAILQSSSAVTALAVSLVDAGVISFAASLGILLGSNVGTTATAWLVSFKLTGIGPFFIVIGALISALPIRISVLGKAIFYFGVVFFALDLISDELKPIQESELMMRWLAMATTPWLGVLIGMLFTAIVQSSSVTTGLSILLVQQGILPPEAAIPIVIGSNVGSTSTALVAGMKMNPVAKATAISNLLFNVFGALLYLPFLGEFSKFLIGITNDPGIAVALAHLIFNLNISLLLLALLGIIRPWLERWLLPNSS